MLGLTLAFTDLALAAYFLVRARRIFEAERSGFGGGFEVGVAELFGLSSVGAALASGLAFLLSLFRISFDWSCACAQPARALRSA